MTHLLDNPVWNALSSGNRNLAGGDDAVGYYPKDVSPFVGLAWPASENFERLYELIPFDGYFAFWSLTELFIPAPWKVLRRISVFQMVCEQPSRKADETGNVIVPLNDTHIPAMLELTKMTNPGPFFNRTIDFGHYIGIFDGDKLIAMAGQRMHPEPYAEISAVCTHPDYLGRGHAARLLLNQVERIKASQETPFLHVLTENTRAIGVYQSLGFTTRQTLNIYSIQKGQ